MDYQQSRDEFKQQLDQEHQWPGWYLFKFIVPRSKEEEVKALGAEMRAFMKDIEYLRRDIDRKKK